MNRIVFTLTLGISLLLTGTNYAQQKVTYFEHVEPIIQKRCAPCHRPGTAAPFSLLRYEDVSKRSKMITLVTSQRYMPPWKADPHYRSFANEKRLTEEEIGTIRDWVLQGSQPGKESRRKPRGVPAIDAARKPDTTLYARRTYTIRGDGKENFILFVIPFEFPEEKNVASIEYLSDNFPTIHHANFGIYAVDAPMDIYADSIPIPADDYGFIAGRQAELTKNLVYYNGWVPGATPIQFSQEIGIKLPKRGVIIITNHYAPLSTEKQERPAIGLHFSKVPVTRSVRTLSIGSGGVGEIEPPLILLANEVSTFRVRMEVSSPLSLMYIWPHMHLLGKKITAYYTTPQNDTIPLVRINAWDFNWQEAYKFKKLEKLPAGAVLTVEAVYDNTAANPSNPNTPPQMVFSDGLMGTKNEMLSLILVYLSYREGDENRDL